MKSLTVLLCLGLAAVVAHAGEKDPMVWPAAYSVDTEMDMSGMKITTKMLVDGKKMRTDSNMAGNVTISIMRPDKKMSYTLMPAQMMVMESALPDEPAAAPATPAPEIVWEKIGSETVNGEACTVYKMTASGTTTTYYINASKLPVRMKTDTMTMDYKNFKVGTPDAALFEVPAGYSAAGTAPAAAPADSSGSSADNASGDAGSAPTAEPAKPAKKKKLGMLGR